jgi:hypothetical protein
MSAPLLAQFAELVFAYIDELSAASVAGHADELATAERSQERRLERLALDLVRGASDEVTTRRAERADWAAPTTVTVLLVPDLRAPARRRLLRSLRDYGCVLGPARPWLQTAASYRRALRAARLLTAENTRNTTAYDTDAHLAELVLSADPEALADLQARALKPLDDLTPAAREKLVETLRLWLLFGGRREAVAAGLFVHPQTVRYRMGQLRELFGDDLDDPHVVLDLVLALGVPPTGGTRTP